jgi:fatty acid desaturase
MGAVFIVAVDRKERIIKTLRLFIAAILLAAGSAVFSGATLFKTLAFVLFAVWILVTLVLILDWWREARNEPMEFRLAPRLPSSE